MRFWRILAVVAGVLLIIAALAQVFRGSAGTVVENIVDGDTIDVRLDGQTTRVRLLNVDTPELGDPPECFAEEARDYLERTIPPGTTVRLEYDADRHDRYGRTLAGVFKDGTFINAQIAREGLGVAVSYAPNYRFYSQVKAAELKARMEGGGLHGVDDGTCYVPPAATSVPSTPQHQV